jgi:UDP-N-acetylmuramoylalanine--D-glutamate ligase
MARTHSTLPELPKTTSGAASRVDWRGCRVTIMGLGRHGGGVAAARYLASRGARVTITDVADANALAESVAQLKDMPIAGWSLGGHRPTDILEAEAIVVNPAVRPDQPLLRSARDAGARLTSEAELFLRACPAQVIGVTGSNGKSTSCTMLAQVLQAAGRHTWLGGNIGHSLLGDVEVMSADDWVVLELSSFQLAHLSDSAPMPRHAIVTGCTANHLDWHVDLADYVRAKQRLVREQPPGGMSVWDADDESLRSWQAIVAGKVLTPWPLERVPALAVAGLHNRQNAARVAALAESLGIDQATIGEALAAFRGLEHRIEFVREVAGRRFYNDSKSTTPEAAMAALEAVAGPLWWLAGGVSKGARFEELAGVAARRARGVALFGAARQEMAGLLRQACPDLEVFSSERLQEAAAWCWQRSAAGDGILLSPACASLDQFRDYAHRGQHFCRWVAGLSGP